MRSSMSSFVLVALTALLLTSAAPASSQSDLQIEAKAVPGQLDLVQGTAIQLGGTTRDGGAEVGSYRWEIIDGDGGRLIGDDRAEAIFQAPMIETPMELFIVQLTAEYPGQDPAKVSLIIRVHKDPPVEKLQESKEKARQLAAQAKQSSTQKEVHHHHHDRYPRWSVNFGFGWGYPWGWGWGSYIYYPIYVPIIIPDPGAELLPGEGDWAEPLPIPYDDLVETFPSDIVDDYLPQDFPLADVLPEAGLEGDGGLMPDFGDDLEIDAMPTDPFPEPAIEDFPQPEPFEPMDPGGFDDFGGGGFDDFGGGFDDFGGGFGDIGWD